MNLNPIAGIIEAVGQVAGDLVTTDKERMAADLAVYTAETERLSTQTEINKVEAGSEDWFVRRWRPAVGWVGVLAMAYQFVLYPFLVWGWSALQAGGLVAVSLSAPPMLETDALWVILTGLLGIGGMRSFDKRAQK